MTTKFRAKLTPQSTPRGLPVESDPPAIYGDLMTPDAFATWKENVDEDETNRLGAPAFRRELVPVDDEGNEIPDGPKRWAALLALYSKELTENTH